MNEVEIVWDETSALANVIRNTSIYQEFQKALEELKEHPQLKARTDEFRTRNYLAYNSLKEPASFVEFGELEANLMELIQYPQIERYLKAELALCRMLQEVENQLTADICFD